MPIAISVKTAKLISVHDQPDTLRLELPSITPGTYFIPGINASDQEFEKCIFTFPNRAPVQYATRHELNGKTYVEIEVFEGKTPQYGTELDQKQDENGRPMEPQLRRALLTVTAEDIANELERQARYFDQNIGVRAINHEVELSDLASAEKDNIQYLREMVHTTSRYLKFGAGNATSQARSAAAKLHKLGLLNPLPEWATINPDGGASVDTFNCTKCGSVLRKGIIKCPGAGCGYIYDWKAAVEGGMIAPRDVPPIHRRAAGLDVPKSVLQAEVAEKVAKDFQEGRV